MKSSGENWSGSESKRSLSDNEKILKEVIQTWYTWVANTLAIVAPGYQNQGNVDDKTTYKENKNMKIFFRFLDRRPNFLEILFAFFVNH